MKKLTVLLATLFVFFSADAQQILSGIYSGSMYNDTTKMLTKYELALSEYRGKVFGYSYNTFIVNDTFYYGIRRVKGYKNDKGELVLTDEELLANNFPESPAKRIKRTAVFPLAQEDTITFLTGSWQTNRTRQYYSVGGATKTERSVDSSQSPLVAHLKELDIISSGPNYQDDPVVKGKKKDEKKPKEVKEEEAKETGTAKRNDKKAEADKPREDKPAVKTTADANTTAANKPAPGNATPKDEGNVAAAGRKEPATTGGQKENDPTTTAAAKPSANTSAPAASAAAPANANKPVETNPVANNPGTTTGAPAKDVPTVADKKPATGTNPAANNPTAVIGSAPQKEAPATAKPVVTTGNPVAATVNNDEIDPTTGDLVIKKPAAAPANNKPSPAATTPVNDRDVAKTTDKKEPAKAVNEAVAASKQADADKVSGQKSEVASNATTNSTTTRPSEKPAAVVPVAAAALDTRTSAVIKTLEIVNDSVTLSFYDNGVVDGDVISVFVNGENVVASQKLNEVAIKKTVHLTNFAADSVEVTLVAETLGSIPPNTGLVLVHDGDKRYDVRFSADMKTNASIIFRKVKK